MDKIYKVIIKETVERELEVMAPSPEEAIKVSRQRFEAQWPLTPLNPQIKKVEIQKEKENG